MAKSDTGATAHYLTQFYAHSLFNVQPTNMEHQVRLPENITINQKKVVHLPLSLPPAITETHVLQH